MPLSKPYQHKPHVSLCFTRLTPPRFPPSVCLTHCQRSCPAPVRAKPPSPGVQHLHPADNCILSVSRPQSHGCPLPKSSIRVPWELLRPACHSLVRKPAVPAASSQLARPHLCSENSSCAGNVGGARAASRQGPASTLPAQPLRARLPCAEQAGVVADTPAASAMPHSNHSTLPHYIRHADAVLCPRGAPPLSSLPISCRRLALRDGVSPQRSKAPLQCSTRRLPCTWAGSGTRYRHDRTHNARGGRRITPPRHARARLCSPFGQLVLSRAARGFFSMLFFPSLFCGWKIPLARNIENKENHSTSSRSPHLPYLNKTERPRRSNSGAQGRTGDRSPAGRGHVWPWEDGGRPGVRRGCARAGECGLGRHGRPRARGHAGPGR